MSSEEIKIKMDGGKLTRSVDGKVMLGGAGCLTWALLIPIGLATLGGAAIIPSLIIGFLGPNDDVSLGNIFELLGLVLFLGYSTFYLYNKIRRGKTTINPAAKLITIGAREISFADVETVISKSSQLPLMDGAVLITFYAALRTEKLEGLGSISGEPEKIDASATQILTILREAIMGQLPRS